MRKKTIWGKYLLYPHLLSLPPYFVIGLTSRNWFFWQEKDPKYIITRILHFCMSKFWFLRIWFPVDCFVWIKNYFLNTSQFAARRLNFNHKNLFYKQYLAFQERRSRFPAVEILIVLKLCHIGNDFDLHLKKIWINKDKKPTTY